ncbi:bifunctional methionine sulfoxide reductase B/A protein [Shewanella avicenniae]|uniref:Peptide methionine sulfoxide reductase MsrA n=1 Tax=Shewanella avicenniae TaxID=2814294 RepID=A0ABX7QWT6_9GAMM|nr:bifunctional methionine sulfoxide reductase B/A protein [Shewanella avicenniae]QSX35440.1 bifunctional methionine sulfoxide reductase B/A protein [Shewanella avicenniae]
MQPLDEFEQYVIEQKGTERPFSGKYYHHNAAGRYLCRKCAAPLYLSEHKFMAHCGWPAFDDEIPGAVTRVPDADGRRVEIVCSQCGGHLGHVFEGEQLTAKNLRHCVNSVSMTFEPLTNEGALTDADGTAVGGTAVAGIATVGGGCFWCTEAVFKDIDGVLEVLPGYAGGSAESANYREVCSGDTGHAEVVQIKFIDSIISYQEILTIFFASHDPTTLNRQGNDVGTQYRSVIFAHSAEQADIANQLIEQLKADQVYDAPIVTEVTAYETFFRAEEEHLDYFARHPQQPYCAVVINPKVAKIRQRFSSYLKP